MTNEKQMSEIETPKADVLLEKFGAVQNPAVIAYHTALCESERENHTLIQIWRIEADQCFDQVGKISALKTVCDNLERKNYVLRSALKRLRDCDFVITPMDRMDAVREIARNALNHSDL
jgi:hypothetical protein